MQRPRRCGDMGTRKEKPMTNEVPDFKKIADKTILNFVPTLGHKEPVIFEEDFDKLRTEIVCAMQSAYLAGRKAQVKVDAEIARKQAEFAAYESIDGEDTGISIAKAIESQVIE